MRNGVKGYISLWLSLFSLYRVLEYPTKVKLDSITNPSTINVKVYKSLIVLIPDFLNRLLALTKDVWLSRCLIDPY
jgi:hypothetical protein